MANDSLLKDFLQEEQTRLDDADFLESMRNYLLTYQQKYGYDSVFLVSTKTSRYYHFNGIDRILTSDNPENIWYYSFLESQEEYSLNIDNDEATNNEITVFINCKIKDTDGAIVGIVGVGFRVDSLQQLLKEYEGEFDVNAYLVDQEGNIQVSTDQTGYEKSDLFTNSHYPDLKTQILSDRESRQSFWYSYQTHKGYLVTKYVPTLEWFLIIDNDTSALSRQLSLQFLGGILVVVAVITIALLLITKIIRRYNAKIIELTVAKENEHRAIFQTATKQLYENIYELDVTHNRAASEATELYFESLGVPRNTPYDRALFIVAQKQIKEEFRDGYIKTFHPSNVLKLYQDGVETLRYDFMITNDGQTYYWMRITARIFYWEEDQSIRMFTYRQNIDEEKRQEAQMLDQMQMDSLSGLYNKASTQAHIQSLLEKNSNQLYAFFIVDIDNFKKVNDSWGHSIGDQVITDFAGILKSQFRPDDVVGRIGGDEFVAFLKAPSREWVKTKAHALSLTLHHDFHDGEAICPISASIGVSIAPDAGTDFETLYKNADTALYQTKEKGKDGFTIFSNPG